VLLLQHTFKHLLYNMGAMPVTLWLARCIHFHCTLHTFRNADFDLHLLCTQQDISLLRKLCKSVTGSKVQAMLDRDDNLECLEQRE
jgi:hypothetical protein